MLPRRLKSVFTNNKHFADKTIQRQLTNLGIHLVNKNVYYNLSYDELKVHYKNKGEIEGCHVKTKYGNVQTVNTGKFTGRSPNDKWLVANKETAKNIWWSDVNKEMSPEVFNILYKKCIDHYNSLENYYLFEGHCGASKDSQKNVSFLTEYAWQHHFVKNMFIEKELEKDKVFIPDFTIINACNVVNDNWQQHGLNSDVFVAFNIDENIAIIGGTHYGGEMKKGIFSLMNYHLPLENIMTMHCSANIGKEGGETALFFGLSGTGKTTLSADPKRRLIGDDEHGWDNSGIFNLEGGCYAKTIGLEEENEPDIFRAIRENALLENIWYDKDFIVDYNNTEKTQNGRVSYPLSHIENRQLNSLGCHPKHIIFLTCDAFGVLPPISKLDKNQAMYHFLSGYTAKVAGTERGIDEPQATFSACFGAAFLPLHPSKYADLLRDKIEKHGSQVWLVNTGWTGGGPGTGKRMSIETTRSCITAILENNLDNVDFRVDSQFDFLCPLEVPEVNTNILTPENTWNDKSAYQNTKNKLIHLFRDNYKQYNVNDMTDYSEFGPQLLDSSL